MARAEEVDLAVAFIKTTGLRLLLPDLHAALGLDEERARPPARLRVLTSDYLDVTDPEVRNPAEADHLFRLKPTRHSDASRPPVAAEGDH